MSELARELIAECQRTQSTYLDLGNCGLTDLNEIPELFECTHLEELVLSDEWWDDEKGEQQKSRNEGDLNSISVISQSFRTLKNLKILILGYRYSALSQISDISFLKDLAKLTYLDLSYNHISDISFLKDLYNLTNLNLSYNHISDISCLKELRNLTNLNLDFNQISDISFLKELVNLTNLELKDAQISDISFLKELRNLTNLSLGANQISDISCLKELVNLTNLALGYNQISDISFLRDLKNLKTLYLSNNHISDISILKDHENLIKLDLRNNHLSKFPEFLLVSSMEITWNSDLLRHYNNVNLYNNPIENIPIEIIQQGKAAIRRYLDEERGTPLNEAKLLILGEGNAGKSTMVEKLLDPDYKLTALATTHGIVVRPWHFAPYTAHIWDFGGQAIYHATHRFFLTQRSLYVLVTDNRAEDTDFNYWFEKIALFGGDSPLIIVQNERDNRKKELSATITGATLNNLKQVVQVNFADNRGLAELIQALKTQFCGLAHINQPFPKRWRKVREALEGLDENHISWDMYSRLCKDNGIPEKEVQSDLCRYLHDLGILLHFEDSPLLKKTVFLQPDWVTGAVYHLLDFIGKGLFTEGEAAAVWSTPENNGLYDDMHTELLALISKFEICYAREQFHILPQLLTENAPAYTWHSADNLQLIYRYGFMPQGILWRLMVRLNRYLPDTNLVWKKGAIFTREEAKAEITEENYFQKREIRIRVSGKFKKEFLTILLEELEHIHRSYHFEKVQEESRPQIMVPCNCSECRNTATPHFYLYSNLKRRISKGIETVECENSFEKANVRGLLDDVFPIQKQLEFLGKWEPGGEEYTMLHFHGHGSFKNLDPLKVTLLFEQIDNNEFDTVFETLGKNKAFFSGYQDLRDRFIHDNPKGTELQKFKQSLKIFINSKLQKD